jgi:hypothetical protein
MFVVAFALMASCTSSGCPETYIPRSSFSHASF